MTIAAVGARARPVVLSPYAIRWLIIAMIGAGAILALRLAGVSIEGGRLLFLAKLVAVTILGGTLYWALGRVVARARPAMAMLTDFCLSFAQFLVLGAAIAPWISIAVLARFPLRDAALARLDAVLFGVRWDNLAAWVTAHPWLDQFLVAVYSSVAFQTVAVLVLGSLFRTGDRNGEFLWHFGLTLIVTTAVFVFTPALGNIGHGGTSQIDTLNLIRSGHWTTYELTQSDGIINFPSFHAALCVLFAYGARHRWWAAAVAVPLNIAMLASTPTVGGHYLVDLPAGVALAVLAIVATRWLRQRWDV